MPIRLGIELTEDERDRAWSVDWRREYQAVHLVKVIKNHGRTFTVQKEIYRNNRHYYPPNTPFVY